MPSIHALALAFLLTSDPVSSDPAGRLLRLPQADGSHQDEPQEEKERKPIEWREVVPEERSDRPWLGVSLGGEDQLEVQEVHSGSPAARAELEPGDRLVSIGRDELGSFADLQEALGERRPGEEVELTFARSLRITLSDEHRAEDGRPLLGVYLDGNRITGVQEGHPASDAGLEKGDRIVALGGESTTGHDQVVDRLRATDGDSLDVRIERTVELELGERPADLGELGQGLGRTPRFGVPGAPSFPWTPEGDLFQGHDHAALQEELRGLSEEIANLRREITELRAQIQALQESSLR
jgi:membrane-associated protease RseP (regulator of RpoE activity)